MKKFSVLVAAVLILLTSTVFAAKGTPAEQRAEIEKLHAQTLERLYAKYPAAERVLGECYAYATLSNSGVKVLLFGSAHGRGVAINNDTGERVYLRMKEVSAGLGIGATEYDLVFVIEDKEAWDSFIVGKTRFSTKAEASASDGSAGGTVEGADFVAKGVWVYQMTKKGLSLEATLGGMKIYADKKLNKDK